MTVRKYLVHQRYVSCTNGASRYILCIKGLLTYIHLSKNKLH